MLRSTALVLPLLLATGCVVSAGEDHAPLYAACGQLSDCEGRADECFEIRWTDGTGPMCSLYCESDLDCFGDAKCYELYGDPRAQRICYQHCVDQLDCAPGFTCVDAMNEGVDVPDICLPS